MSDTNSTVSYSVITPLFQSSAFCFLAAFPFPIGLDDLVDGAEDRTAALVKHFDTHSIAKAHVSSRRLASFNDFQHLFFHQDDERSGNPC